MSVEWPKIFLGDLYEYRSGLSKPRSAFGSGFGFLSFKDVFYNFFVPDQLTELVNSTAQERALCSIRRGDVFLTRTSETMEELGMSCVALKDYESATFNGFCKRLRPKPDTKIHPEYAAYYFRSPSFRRAVTAMSSMSTRASLNNEMLDRLIMLLPPLREQEAIGAILKKLDDKIELNRKMNRTLEEMAQAIFKSWFVDFDGVLDEEMIDSELGPIPKGWKVSEIGKVVQVLGGSTPSTTNPDFWNDGIHSWTTPKDLSSSKSPILINTARRITDAGLAQISSGLLPVGTFLLSSRAPVGYTAIACVPVAINQGYIAIPPGGQLTPLYLLHWAKMHLDVIKGRAGGTTFEEISKSNFRPIPAIIPPADKLMRFDEVVGSIFSKIEANERMSSCLTDLRDTLLPKLMSGEIRVPEAESAVETVL